MVFDCDGPHRVKEGSHRDAPRKKVEALVVFFNFLPRSISIGALKPPEPLQHPSTPPPTKWSLFFRKQSEKTLVSINFLRFWFRNCLNHGPQKAKYRIKGDAKKMKMASAAGASHSLYGRAPQARVRLLHERNCILHHKQIAEICCQSMTFQADHCFGASSKHRLCAVVVQCSM